MESNKKKVVVLVAVVIAILLGLGAWLLLKNPEFLSTDYTDTEEEDGFVRYDGKKYQYNEHLSNYLFLGIDKRTVADGEEDPGKAGQADAILLLSYNRLGKTIRCVSIPRDTMTVIRTFAQDGTDLGKSKDHLNIQYAFGDGKEKSCKLMEEAVEMLLYDVPIQGYCSLSMAGIPEAVDAVGQVELVVPDNTLANVNADFQEGNTVLITKENAEQFVRYRDTDIRQSAMQRGSRQKVFVKAFAKAAKDKQASDEGFVTTIYEKLRPYMVTNMGNDVFVKILQAQNASEDMFVDIPGEAINGEDFDEYRVDQDALYKLVLEMFYVEVQED